MDLNLFENKQSHDSFIDKFIEQLRKALEKAKNSDLTTNEEQNTTHYNDELDEYDIYEKRKIFLDNKSRNGNDFAWIMDENSVCISEGGDGGPISIEKITLPQNTKVGEVYEKIDGQYVYNPEITTKLHEINKDL